MYKYSFLFLIIFLVSKDVTAQASDHVKTNEWISIISKYRDHLLQKNPNSTIELKQLINKWNTLGATEEEKSYLTFNILYARKIEKMNLKSIRKYIKKYKPNSKAGNSITEEDISIITKNSELLELIHLGLLKATFPFKIDPKTDLLEELKTYNLKDGEKIGEIGCGSGTFAMLLHQIQPNSQLYLNEINRSFFSYINLVLAENENFYQKKNISLIKGKKKNTKLEGYNLDKIIIRKTFHHFSKKDKMLDSIKKSLKPNGELYIMEYPIELNQNNEDACKISMRRNDIIGSIVNNGFVLINEVVIGRMVILKFKIKK